MDNENINNEVNTDLQEQGKGLNEAYNSNAEVKETAEGEKTFTQQQLNDIVEKRLAKERKRLMGMIADDEATKAELTKNRLQLEVTKKLTRDGHPIELADLMDYSDEEKCNASYKQITEVFNIAVRAEVDRIFKANGRTPHPSNSYSGGQGGALRSAFGLNRGD